jgi:hypothetical protein
MIFDLKQAGKIHFHFPVLFNCICNKNSKSDRVPDALYANILLTTLQ